MIQLITNSVWRDSAQIIVTDNSDVVTTDATSLENISRGPRHLEASISGLAARRIVYVNKRGNLSANCCVLTRSDRLTSGYTIRKYTTYSSTSVTLEDSAGAPTGIGLNSQDYVLTFGAASSLQALSIQNKSTAAKTVGKVYFGNAIDLLYPGQLEIEPRWARFLVRRREYLVREVAKFSFERVTAAVLQSVHAAYKLQEEPVFLYDSAGTLLEDKLWHCVLSNVKVNAKFSDHYTLEIEAYRLREYPSVA